MASRCWVMLGMVVLGGCTCDPKSEPDASTPDVVAWPEGARLEVTATTESTADVAWPAALGPVTSYRLSSSLDTRDTTETSARFTSLAPGRHVTVEVVALDEAGHPTPPLRAEVAPAPKLAVTEGDISTDFCGASAFLWATPFPARRCRC